MARRRKALTMAERGRLGGKATVARYGVEHMRTIGKAGFAGLARSLGYMGGSRRGALLALLRAGKIRLPAAELAAHDEASAWAEELMERFHATCA